MRNYKDKNERRAIVANKMKVKLEHLIFILKGKKSKGQENDLSASLKDDQLFIAICVSGQFC